MTHNESSQDLLNSGIYRGQVRHRRFSPRIHNFSYSLYMLALDLDELPALFNTIPALGSRWFNALKISNKDHFNNDTDIKSNVINAVNTIVDEDIVRAGGNESTYSPKLNGKHLEPEQTKVIMVTQARCFGIYFSPINLYFCYDVESANKTNTSPTGKENCVAMLAEVSNTPWNEKHYYLIDVQRQYKNEELRNQKVFHVSPFMQMDMDYLWKISPPNNTLNVHIENWQRGDHPNKVFDATMALQKQPLTRQNLNRLLIKVPIMTVKIMTAIYWQAAKIFFKRIPFVGHPGSKATETIEVNK